MGYVALKLITHIMLKNYNSGHRGQKKIASLPIHLVYSDIQIVAAVSFSRLVNYSFHLNLVKLKWK